MTSRLLAATLVATVVVFQGGCCFIDAGARELDDHGDYARYENKSYGEHLFDATFEDDDDDECHAHCRCWRHG